MLFHNSLSHLVSKLVLISYISYILYQYYNYFNFSASWCFKYFKIVFMIITLFLNFAYDNFTLIMN